MSRPLAVIAIVLAAAAGFSLGRLSAPQLPPPVRTSRGPAPAGATAASVHAALMTPDPLQRAAALGETLDALGPESLAEVQEAFEAVVLDAADYELQLFVLWWARFDAPAAARWAARDHLGRYPSVLASAVRVWAREDPLAARDFTRRQLFGPQLRAPATVALLWGWDESGEPGIWNFIATMRNLPQQQTALAILVRRRLLRDGPEATFRWANQLPDDEPGDVRRLKLNTFRRIGNKLAEIDPVAAAGWAEQVGEGRYGDGVYRRVAWQWAVFDGPATMAWLATLPAGPSRDEAVEEGFRRWLSADRREALAWIAEQENEPWLDPARLWNATVVGSRDPAEGLRVAATLHDPGRRERAEYLILRAWRQRDRAAADAWMAQHPVSGEMLDKLERFPGRGGQPEAGEMVPEPPSPEDALAP